MIGHPPIAEGTRDVRINEIQQLIGTGEYRIEPSAIAEAILRRLAQERKLLAAGLDGTQSECS